MYELKDFQQQTVDYIFKRLLDPKCQRFLCADEVGLGKTIIAKGLIDKYREERGGNLKVFYICSSQYLAQQNLKKLHPDCQVAPITRLTELIRRPELIKEHHGLSILPLSPKTSVDLKSKSGVMSERAYLYRLIKESKILKGRRETTFERVLGLNINNWDRCVNWVNELEFDQSISDSFIRSLAADKELVQNLEACFDDADRDYRSLIGKLRLLLATVSLKDLKPDIIILDEFQRFSEILKQSESEDASDLINALFKNDHTEMLLLSATPYKMYTIREEDEQDESHFEEFRFLMKFLMGEDFDRFEFDWENYNSALLSLKSYTPEEIEALKLPVEKWLYKYMCRTERNVVYESDTSDTLIQPKYFDLPFSSSDIQNFIDTDNVVKCIEGNHPDIYSPLEYCKTVPFPLSFMDGYKLKNLFEEMYDNRENGIRKTVKENEAFLSIEGINEYKISSFTNAKMNWLAENNIRRGANLLWIPPSVPYYKLSGDFSSGENFSKLMIFGRFAVEPRAIATLASYTAEFYTTGSEDARLANNEKKARVYYAAGEDAIEDDIDDSPDEKKQSSRIPRRRLNFKANEIPYSLYCLYYPSLFLSDLIRSNLSLNTDKNSDDLLILIEGLIKGKLLDMNKYVQRKSERTDARWYLFALLYLDQIHCTKAFNQISGDKLKEYISKNGLHMKLNRIIEYIDIIKEGGPKALADSLSLGEVPEDLTKVLAMICLGSPSVLTSVIFQNSSSKRSDEVLTQIFGASLSIGDAFRSYFNQPESISIVDIRNQNRYDYWLAVMDYCIAGCLISVLDECYYMHCDGNYSVDGQVNSISKFVKYLIGVLGLRTANLSVDMVDPDKKVVKKPLRTHYAIAFMDQVENDDTISRKGGIQDSFNSPFRPFILATTSIGQEGLDFHKYCRQLMHWSLPGNAIDLEQREGRINRYKHFALRKNLAYSYLDQIQNLKIDQPVWTKIFDIAVKDDDLRGEHCQLIPFWHVPRVTVPLERLVLTYPYSKDSRKLDHLLKTLTVYRMSLGQPDQEDLVRYLLTNFTPGELAAYKAKLLINLSPVAYEIMGKRSIIDATLENNILPDRDEDRDTLLVTN